MRAGALLAALVLAPLVASGATPEPLHLERAMDRTSLDADEAPGEWSGKPLSLADVDRDGDLDLIAQNANGLAYVIDLLEGRVLVEVEPRAPYARDLGPFNAARAADLDGDGTVELVSVDRAAVVTVWSLMETAVGLAPRFLWERHLNDHYPHPTADAGPVLADLDADGVTYEIIVQTEERGSYALRHDGSLLWSLDVYGGNAEPLVQDMDQDGDLDVVFFTDGGTIRVVDGEAGDTLWTVEVREAGVWPGSITGAGLAEDLDGDGRMEIVFCARNLEDATPEHAPGAPGYRQHHLALAAAREGELLWLRKPAWANPLCAAQLMSADADGDGRREIYGLDWNTLGHKPGNWEQLGDAHVFAFDHEGKELWHHAVDPWIAKANLALADGDGDGDLDVLAYDRDDLLVLDARSGERSSSLDLRGWSVKQGPVVGDLLGDGVPRLVVAAYGRSHALLLVRLPGSPLAPAWPGWSAPTASAVLREAPVAAAPAWTPPPAPGLAAEASRDAPVEARDAPSSALLALVAAACATLVLGSQRPKR